MAAVKGGENQELLKETSAAARACSQVQRQDPSSPRPATHAALGILLPLILAVRRLLLVLTMRVPSSQNFGLWGLHCSFWKVLICGYQAGWTSVQISWLSYLRTRTWTATTNWYIPGRGADIEQTVSPENHTEDRNGSILPGNCVARTQYVTM